MHLDAGLSHRIAERLSRPLPGTAAQVRFAPELSYGRHQIPPLPAARSAAVLVLLYPFQDEWHIPLMLRAESLPLHAGQVSFPGGELEPGEDAQCAALREFTEELGAADEGFVVLGRLSPLYVYASNYLVTPCLAVAPCRPLFRANPAEVAGLLELPVRVLRDPGSYGVHWSRRKGIACRVPDLEFQGHRIWGATGMILAEFSAILAEVEPA